MRARRILFLALFAFAAFPAANAQGFDKKVVLMGLPGNDASLWTKLSSREDPITNVEQLKRRFATDYLIIEPDKNWVVLIDKKHPSLVRLRTRTTAFEIFLKYADAKGTVRLGDLKQSERDDLIDLFGGADSSLWRMGKDTDNVKIGFRATLYISATVADRTVGTTINPEVINDPEKASAERKAFMKDMVEHGVPDDPMSKEQHEAILKQLDQDVRNKYGLVFRYIGVHERAQPSAIRVALDALEKYLIDTAKETAGTYASLESKYLSANLEELGGKVPSTLPKEQLPSRLANMFGMGISHRPELYGFKDTTEVERFMSGIKSYDVKASYEIFYLGYRTDASGNKRAGAGYSVELVRY